MENAPNYTPPKIWEWTKPSGGTFANVNRPTAGATFDRELPIGEHPLQLYSMGTPNGIKITILLEELLAIGHADAEYDAWMIDIFKGDQFSSGFIGVNPNSKIPALVDRSGPEPISVFESGSILLYLADKFGEFLPYGIVGRTTVLNWLFWQVGSAPYVGGGFGHFYTYAPIKIEYAINRFTMEVKRLLDVLDRRLAESEYIGGTQYSIADIAIFPWYGALVQGAAYDAAEFIAAHEYKNVIRWSDTIMARPAVQRGRRVSSTRDDVPNRIRERHNADDLDA